MDDTAAELKDMDLPELLEHIHGGLFGLFSEDKEYDDLLQVAAALGLKRFVDERLAGRSKKELLAMFEHGERLVDEFVAFAADQGLIEEGDEDD